MKGTKYTLLAVGAIMFTGKSFAEDLKRIEISKTNNFQLDARSTEYQDPNQTSKEDLGKLATYVRERMADTNLSEIGDPSVIVTTLDWVSTQWRHDGLNQPPKNASALSILQSVHKNGARYRCVEYGFVHSEILKSLGYQSRPINLRSKDVAYGGFGMGHVASEIWSNNLNKWIFVDPQFSIYPTYQGTYLNFYEMYELKKNGKFDEIEFNISPNFLKKSEQTKDHLVAQYRSFIENYFGYISTRWYKDGKNYLVMLNLEGKKQHLTFQGMGADNYIFTNRPDDLYFDINRTLITFSFRESSPDNFKEQMSRLQVKTNEDYLNKMAYFAAKPNLRAALHHNMPNFAYFEIKKSESDDWQKVDGTTFDFDLTASETRLLARAVNTYGLPGPVTFIDFKYH